MVVRRRQNQRSHLLDTPQDRSPLRPLAPNLVVPQVVQVRAHHRGKGRDPGAGCLIGHSLILGPAHHPAFRARETLAVAPGTTRASRTMACPKADRSQEVMDTPAAHPAEGRHLVGRGVHPQ